MRVDRSRNGAWLAAAAGAWLAATIGAGPASVAGADSKKESVTVQKTKDGLHFNLPPDWPLEKRGGVTAPIPIEEYLSQKFSAVSSQLQSLEQRVNSLDVKLRVVEEDLKQRPLSANDQSPNNNNQTSTNTQIPITR